MCAFIIILGLILQRPGACHMSDNGGEEDERQHGREGVGEWPAPGLGLARGTGRGGGQVGCQGSGRGGAWPGCVLKQYIDAHDNAFQQVEY